MTTLTSVGFGDIHHVTTSGRLIISFAILIASAVVPAQAVGLIESLFDREGEQNQNNGTKAETLEATNSQMNEGNEASDSSSLISTRIDRLEDKLDR